MNELLSVGGFKSYKPNAQEYICDSFNYPTLAYRTLTNKHLDDGSGKDTTAIGGGGACIAVAVDGKPPVMKGWLMKQGHVVKNWKKRHFVLDDGILIYYEEERYVNEKGRLRVCDYHVTYSSGASDFNMIANSPTEKSYALKATDWDDSIAWRKALVAHGLTTMGKMDDDGEVK
jgi:hypothetical protein